MKGDVFSKNSIFLLMFILFAAGYVIGGQVVITKVPVTTNTPFHNLVSIADSSGFSVDSNADNKIDAANNADWATNASNAESLGGVVAAKYVRRDCVYLKDNTGGNAGTNIYNSGNAHIVPVNIPSGVCGNGYGAPTKCTIVMLTSNYGGSSDTAVAEYFQNDGLGTWGAIVGGTIRGSVAATGNSGNNGDGIRDVIMRDSQSTKKIFLYDDDSSETSTNTQWVLSDSDDNWAVSWVMLCNY
ncbi:MAG: hypothetical protein NUV97_00145 [archaeon]|nr:hypothetical protein [archaeon]MCR4323588.1 hypothetical protein [Nanoarchaeota archaeon]